MIAKSTLRLAVAIACLLSPAHTQSLLHIRVLEGEGALRRAGGKDARALLVQVTDEAGNPAGGVTVSFRLPEEGPGGSFEGGMKTDIVTTTPDGRASMYGVVWNRAAGPFQVRVTAVKSDVRAGTVVAQTLTDALPGKRASGAGSRRKWIAIAAIAGGAAAAGLAAGTSKASTAPVTGSTPVPVPPPQVGLPTITIGKP